MLYGCCMDVVWMLYDVVWMLYVEHCKTAAKTPTQKHTHTTQPCPTRPHSIQHQPTHRPTRPIAESIHPYYYLEESEEIVTVTRARVVDSRLT